MSKTRTRAFRQGSLFRRDGGVTQIEEEFEDADRQKPEDGADSKHERPIWIVSARDKKADQPTDAEKAKQGKRKGI